MKIRRAVAVLLGVGLLAGCSGNNTKIAATYNNGEIPAGVYIYYQIMAAGEAYQALGDYTIAPADVLERDIDGEKGSDFVTRRATEMIQQHAITEFACEQEAIAVDPVLVEQMNAALAKQWETDGESMEISGISLASMQQVGLNAQKSSMLFEKWYKAGGEREVPTEEIEAYYKENYRRILFLHVPKYDSSGAMLEGDALKEREALIEDYDSRLKGGAKLFDVLVEFDKLIHTLTEVAHTHGDLVESEQETVVEKKSTDYPADLVEKIFSEGSGVERYEGNGFTLFFERRDLLKDKTHLESADLSIRFALRQKDFGETLAGMKDASGFKLNEAAIKRFKPENIKLSF